MEATLRQRYGSRQCEVISSRKRTASVQEGSRAPDVFVMCDPEKRWTQEAADRFNDSKRTACEQPTVHRDRLANGIVMRAGEKVGLASANAVLTGSRVLCNELVVN